MNYQIFFKCFLFAVIVLLNIKKKCMTLMALNIKYEDQFAVLTVQRLKKIDKQDY